MKNREPDKRQAIRSRYTMSAITAPINLNDLAEEEDEVNEERIETEVRENLLVRGAMKYMKLAGGNIKGNIKGVASTFYT